MHILSTTYHLYVCELQRAKIRVKRDKEIIRIVSRMIHTKTVNEKRLHELLIQVTEQRWKNFL